MKNKIIFSLMGLVLMASCKKDFLNRPSLNAPTVDNYYNTAEQVQGRYHRLFIQPGLVQLYRQGLSHHRGSAEAENGLTSAGDANYGQQCLCFILRVQSTDGQLLKRLAGLFIK